MYPVHGKESVEPVSWQGSGELQVPSLGKLGKNQMGPTYKDDISNYQNFEKIKETKKDIFETKVKTI